MAILFTCSCGTSFYAADEFAGRTIKCPSCKKTTAKLAEPTDEAADFEILEDDPQPSTTEPKKARVRAIAVDDAPEPEPRPKKPKKKKRWCLLSLARVTGGMVRDSASRLAFAPTD
ncbi:hypothetical protein [Frigoriglobus tundricola]|uniref:Uncharacterized protein n=1 Tax=Frigoriglobus tundricola TaxID=2774151 RepID=A0A6M5YZI1_9BACT|nr:hypothetical protein [Frigoriglobus tundricola]QJW98866.1 hypothetical protein FTUN_6461 [Frigoriglobus tundricola]